MAKLTHDPAELQAVALEVVTRIFAAWGLSDDEAAALLDVSQSAWRRLKAGRRDVDLTEEQLLRISALVSIYRAPGEFFGAPLATEWIMRPNTDPLLGGRRPLDKMVSEGPPAFLAIRRYLQALPENRTVLDGIVMHPTVASAIKETRQRGAAAAMRILSAPDMLSVGEAAELMGASSEDVFRAVQDNNLLAIEMAGHDPRLPAWQFDGSGLHRAGLVEALGVLGNGWSAFRFFAATYQGITNRERLMNGNLDSLQHSALLWVSDDYV